MAHHQEVMFLYFVFTTSSLKSNLAAGIKNTGGAGCSSQQAPCAWGI